MACPYCGAPGGGSGSCGSCQHHRSGSSVQGAYRGGGGGGGGSGGECFPADAIVYTPSGPKRIDGVQKNEAVFGMNKIGRVVQAPVQRVVTHAVGRLIRIESETSGLSFAVTRKHPLLTPVGWRRAHELNAGDVVLASNLSSRVHAHRVQSVSEVVEAQPVYNLIVKDVHTYLVRGCIAHSFVHFRSLRSALNAPFSELTKIMNVPKPLRPLGGYDA